jgi:hypothetical protein
VLGRKLETVREDIVADSKEDGWAKLTKMEERNANTLDTLFLPRKLLDAHGNNSASTERENTVAMQSRHALETNARPTLELVSTRVLSLLTDSENHAHGDSRTPTAVKSNAARNTIVALLNPRNPRDVPPPMVNVVGLERFCAKRNVPSVNGDKLVHMEEERDVALSVTLEANVQTLNASLSDAPSTPNKFQLARSSKEAKMQDKLNVANGCPHANVDTARLMERNADLLERNSSRSLPTIASGPALERIVDKENAARLPRNALEPNATPRDYVDWLDLPSRLSLKLLAIGSNME